jgi:hypothetical protein
MHASPARLTAAIGSLFAVGSALFVLGSVPAYADAVGGTSDAVTFFVGSLFFTTASFLQLVQAQSPAMTGVDRVQQHLRRPVSLWAWLPRDHGWLAAATQFPGTLFFNVSTFAALAHNATVQEVDQHVWRPDIFGSTLFLVASFFAILALGGRLFTWQSASLDWWIAWINMLGSIFFMWSALGSYVVPGTGDLLNPRASIGGTLLGAACFLIGAILVFPAWRRAVVAVTASASPGKGEARPQPGA